MFVEITLKHEKLSLFLLCKYLLIEVFFQMIENSFSLNCNEHFPINSELFPLIYFTRYGINTCTSAHCCKKTSPKQLMYFMDKITAWA